jgi:DNA-binding PadR family transcriptional regulator
MIATRTAILQALRQGPAYGRLLMRRVSAATGGRTSLAPGSVYPALRALAKARLVRKWTVVTGRVRGGRSRTYYELTVAGIQEAESEARALTGMLLAGRSTSGTTDAERAAMHERMGRAVDLFDFATEARESLARARRRT